MTVSEYFECEGIDRELLDEVSEKSDYWASASNFALKTWDDDIEEMTVKQANWLSKIRDDMIERRIKNQ